MSENQPETPEEDHPDKVEVFLDDAERWRWHRIAANNRVISTSGEAFHDKYNAVRAAERANPETLLPETGVRVYFENEDTPL